MSSPGGGLAGQGFEQCMLNMAFLLFCLLVDWCIGILNNWFIRVFEDKLNGQFENQFIKVIVSVHELVISYLLSVMKYICVVAAFFPPRPVQ